MFFLLDTNSLLKILISEEQKDMWVNEISEGREKMDSTRFFISCWKNCESFMIISERDVTIVCRLYMYHSNKQKANCNLMLSRGHTIVTSRELI